MDPVTIIVCVAIVCTTAVWIVAMTAVLPDVLILAGDHLEYLQSKENAEANSIHLPTKIRPAVRDIDFGISISPDGLRASVSTKSQPTLPPRTVDLVRRAPAPMVPVLATIAKVWHDYKLPMLSAASIFGALWIMHKNKPKG